MNQGKVLQPMDKQDAPLLSAQGIKVHFPVDQGFWSRLRGEKRVVHAVDGVDFSLRRGRTLGLVGESGCGKTTLGKTIVRLYQPTAGVLHFDGKDVTNLSASEFLPVRRQLQMVFQDPYSSLNRRKTVGQILARPLQIHGIGTRGERANLIEEALNAVGIDRSHVNRFPHEFSGGQRQRIGIARALVLDPEMLVLDEPVSALDVSIQAQILNLLMDLQERKGFAYLFIAHDLSVVKRISDDVAVMYLGRIVEQGPAREVLGDPQHPYTQALLSAVPGQQRRRERIILRGTVPSPIHPPPGCRFHTRCPFTKDLCRRVEPQLITLAGEHKVACHLLDSSVAAEMAG
ncbi:MAG: dipeptide ABC transporter ATP-binding protein [Caldilineaceae bacterium]|nr:dipeptide ABC transporter ATP-binding protein [Caldilineaceae bacterium]